MLVITLVLSLLAVPLYGALVPPDQMPLPVTAKGTVLVGSMANELDGPGGDVERYHFVLDAPGSRLKIESTESGDITIYDFYRQTTSFVTAGFTNQSCVSFTSEMEGMFLPQYARLETVEECDGSNTCYVFVNTTNVQVDDDDAGFIETTYFLEKQPKGDSLRRIETRTVSVSIVDLDFAVSTTSITFEELRETQVSEKDFAINVPCANIVSPIPGDDNAANTQAKRPVAFAELFSSKHLFMTPLANKEHVNSPTRIERINRVSKTWKAGTNDMFNNVRVHQAAANMPKVLHSRRNLVSKPAQSKRAVQNVPDSFDARTRWPNCPTIRTVRNQASCGSCYSFATSGAFSDRLCIATEGNFTSMLSPQTIVSCDFISSGCGGSEYAPWDFVQFYGLATNSCMPYQSGEGEVPQCQRMCDDLQPMTLYKSKPGTAFSPGLDVLSIQAEIMTRGPVYAAFYPFDDFYNYKSGVYIPSPGSTLVGGHAIKILGWGTEDGQDYWLVANSWGPTWGEDGFFKILRGKNLLAIENTVSGAEPVLPLPL